MLLAYIRDFTVLKNQCILDIDSLSTLVLSNWRDMILTEYEFFMARVSAQFEYIVFQNSWFVTNKKQYYLFELNTHTDDFPLL